MAMSLADAEPRSVELPEGLLRGIVKHLNPRRVILFGSRARGEAHPDSDWDLLIIVDDDTRPERVNWRALGEARRGVVGAVDLVPMPESFFRDRLDIVGSLPWSVAAEGVTVYDRDERASA
jgi:predicted nucleotidyltransferase